MSSLLRTRESAQVQLVWQEVTGAGKQQCGHQGLPQPALRRREGGMRARVSTLAQAGLQGAGCCAGEMGCSSSYVFTTRASGMLTDKPGRLALNPGAVQPGLVGTDQAMSTRCPWICRSTSQPSSPHCVSGHRAGCTRSLVRKNYSSPGRCQR